jgi:hypothetical protein
LPLRIEDQIAGRIERMLQWRRWRLGDAGRHTGEQQK